MDDFTEQVARDFMAECERYADEARQRKNEGDGEKNTSREVFTGRKVKYILNAKERAFFQNISMEFFSPSKRYIEQFVKETEHSRAMAAAAKVPFMKMFNWGSRWVDKAKGFLSTFFRSKFDAILNTVILIEGILLFKRAKNSVEETWAGLKSAIIENPIYQRIISPTIDYIMDAGGPLFDAFGKAWDDLVEVWKKLIPPGSSAQKIIDFMSDGVDYVFSNLFTAGNIWSLYLEMIKIAGLSYLYGLMGIFGFKPNVSVELKTLAPSAKGQVETIRSLREKGKHGEAEERLKNMEELVGKSLENTSYHYVNSDKLRVSASVDEVKEINELLTEAMYEETHGFFGTIEGWFSEDKLRAVPLSREEIAKRLEDTDLFEDHEFGDKNAVVDEIYASYLQHFKALREGVSAREKDVGPLSRQFSEVARANIERRGMLTEGNGMYFSGYEQGWDALDELGEYARGRYDLSGETISLFSLFFNKDAWDVLVETATLELEEKANALIDSGILQSISYTGAVGEGMNPVQRNVITIPSPVGNPDLNEVVHTIAM